MAKPKRELFKTLKPGSTAFKVPLSEMNSNWLYASRLKEKADKGDLRARRELDRLEDNLTFDTSKESKMLKEPNCFKRRCKHYLGVSNDGDESTERHICKAYPKGGIPVDIAYGEYLHLKVREDQDNDIVFERLPA